MKIKDLQGGYTFEYGGCHDSLLISEDGRSLSYYNLQNGDGSRFGDYRFVMEDGEVPQDSESVCAYYGECYFNIGGFPNVERIRADTIDEVCEFVFFYIDGYYFKSEEEFKEYVKEQLKEQKNIGD